MDGDIYREASVLIMRAIPVSSHPVQADTTEALLRELIEEIRGLRADFVARDRERRLPQQTAAGTYGWTGQAAPTVITKGDFATVTLAIAKASGIIVVTAELARLSQPGADLVLRDELANGLAQFLDTQFVDPAVAAVANVSPASITNGTTAIVSAGTSQANAATDIQALLTQFVAANPDVENMVLLMKPANAVAIRIHHRRWVSRAERSTAFPS